MAPHRGEAPGRDAKLPDWPRVGEDVTAIAERLNTDTARIAHATSTVDSAAAAEDIIAAGRTLGEIGGAIRSLLLTMQQQAAFYAHSSGPYSGPVTDGYKKLLPLVATLLNKYDNHHAARFQLIQQTVNELGVAEGGP